MHIIIYLFLLFSNSYIQYSGIAARLTRRALKPALRVEALKREAVNAKPNLWKDGKPVAQSKPQLILITN